MHQFRLSLKCTNESKSQRIQFTLDTLDVDTLTESGLQCLLYSKDVLGFAVICRESVACMSFPEPEKPRRRVGIADRKVFARLEIFCAYLKLA